MSGDTTYQSLERLTHMPDRADPQGDRIAGQYYDDVYFTGGEISNIDISNSLVAINAANALDQVVKDKLAQIYFSLKDFGAKGDGVTDDTIAIQNAISAADAAGQAVYVPIGVFRYTSTLTIPRGVILFGYSYDDSILEQHGSAFTGIVLNTSISSSGIRGLQVRYSSTTYINNTAAKAIRIGNNNGATASTFGNYTTFIKEVLIGQGYYDQIICETEADCTLIDQVRSLTPVGRSRIFFDSQDTIQNARTAGLTVMRCHMSAQRSNMGQPGQNQYAVYLNSTESPLFINNIFNNHDVEYGIVSTTPFTNSGLKVMGGHSEDFRPWTYTPAAFTPSGSYTIQDFVIPTTFNGFVYQASNTGTAGAEPTWPTTIDATVTTGGVTFRCVSPASREFAISTAYTLNTIVRPTVNAKTGWLYVCTTPGTTDVTEPVWPTTLGGTVTSGTAIFTATYRSMVASLTNNTTSNTSSRMNVQFFGYEAYSKQAGVVSSGPCRVELFGGAWTTANPGGRMTVFAFEGVDDGAVFRAKDVRFQGNIKPWKVATGDVQQATIILENTPTENEFLTTLPNDGYGRYVYYKGLTRYDHRDGTMRAADGSAATPAFSFTTDTDNGLFRLASNTIGVATNGSQRASISSSQWVISPNGIITTNYPTFGTLGNSGTLPGITSVGSGDNSSSVGVFRANNDDAAATIAGQKSKGTYTAGVLTRAAVSANNTNLLDIVAQGDDGANPQNSSRIRFRAGSTVSSGIVSGTMILQTANTSGVLTDGIIITDAQNVGINVSPAAKLDINSGAITPLNIRSNNFYYAQITGNENSSVIGFAVIPKNSAGTSISGAYFSVSGGATPELNIIAPNNTVGPTRGNIILGSNDGSGGNTAAMRIVGSSGDVAIGVSAPSARLHLIKTTEQLRVGYDASNFLSTIVGISGITAFTPSGNIIEQRNGTTAQTLRVYNTFTDASNYERGIMSWSNAANVLHIGSEAAGTGVGRPILLRGSPINFGVGGGPTTVWTMNASGHFLAGTDNTYDIGASAASRPRNLYMASWVRMATSTVAGLPAAATAAAAARMFVTDSNVVAAGNFGNVVAGGGANTVPVYSDGANWRIG
jgi:hypothetical protein